MKTEHVLVVDLSTRSTRTEVIPDETVELLIGGSGVGWALAAENLSPGAGPLSPENVVVISAGKLVGTSAPGASKVGAISLFPTIASADRRHFVGESTAGGRRFGPMLKMAGHDHLVLMGKADAPVYLKIVDDSVEILDASGLWGRSTEDTADSLIASVTDDCGVLTIGPAGENGVHFALAFVDKTNSLGRSGLGAVLGSKNLKAIVTLGTKGVNVAEPERFDAVVARTRDAILDWPRREHWTSLGMGAGWGTFIHTQYPGKWTKQEWDDLYGEKRRLETLDRVIGCNSCLIACRVRWKIRDGEYAGEVGLGSPYGKSATSGQLLDIKDHRQAIHLVTLANTNGLDFYTTTRLIDFVTTLYQSGRLTREDTGGLELSRDYECYLRLFDLIIKREGFGEVLSRGWYGLSQECGLDPQSYWYGGINKGVDFIYDGRASNLHPMMMSFCTRPRPHHGGSHTLTNSPGNTLEVIREQFAGLGLRDEVLDRIFTPEPHTGMFNAGRYTKYMEDWMRIKNALGLCSVYTFFNLMSGGSMAELYSAAVGRPVDAYELMQRGERISNLAKALNAQRGFTRADDRIPDLWFRPMKSPEGVMEMQDYFKTRVLSRDDTELMLDDYYRERGWGLSDGNPGPETLKALGLERWAPVTDHR